MKLQGAGAFEFSVTLRVQLFSSEQCAYEIKISAELSRWMSCKKNHDNDERMLNGFKSYKDNDDEEKKRLKR